MDNGDYGNINDHTYTTHCCWGRAGRGEVAGKTHYCCPLLELPYKYMFIEWKDVV